MNVIQCMFCFDLLAPLERAGVRTCACGTVQMRAVPVAEIGHNNLVEVKLFSIWRQHSYGIEIKREPPIQVFDKTRYELFAQVVKIHNHYLKGDHGLHEFWEEDKADWNLFYRNKSQIVIAPLDTPGVKVVTEWSNKSLPTTEEYLKSVKAATVT